MVQLLTRFDSKKLSLMLLIGFLISVVTAPAYAETISPIYPWQMLGHDGQRTSFSEGPAPDNPDLLWKTENIGAGQITSADGRIFFYSSNYSEPGLFKINCYNESDGSIIWSKTMIGSSSFFIPSLTVYKNKIYFAKGVLLYCLDESSGQVIWETTSTPVDFNTKFSVSPIIDGSSIFITTDGGRYGYAEYCFSFDSSNGKMLWGTKLKGVASIVAVSNNAIILNSYNSTSKMPYTECFNKEKGTLLWRHAFEKLGPLTDPSSSPDMPFVYNLQPPSISQNRVFVGLGSSVYSLNLVTGEKIWEYTFQKEVDTTPAIAYGKIFVASNDGYLYALDQSTGALLWKYPIIHRVFYPLGWISVADGKIFVTTGNPAVLYCINENDGKLNWFKDMGHWVYGLCVANGNLFVSADGIIYAFGSTIISTQSFVLLDIGQTTPTVPPIMISGSIDPPRNGTVEIQWSIDKDIWFYQKTATLNGRYRYSWTPPCNGTFYFKAVWGGDEVYSGATSDVKSVVFSGYDYAKLKSDFDLLNSSYIELEAVNHSLQSQVSSLQSDKNALQSQVASLQNNKANLESQVSSLESNKNALQSQVSSLQADKNILESQVSALQSDKNTLQLGLGAAIAILLIVTVYLFSKK